MQRLMTKQFSKWASKQQIQDNYLLIALNEVQQGKFEANLGGNVFKKRIRFEGQGKSSSGRLILCYKKGNRIIFVHGFAKNEKSNLSKKELFAFGELSKILLSLNDKEVGIAVKNGDLIEVVS